MLKNIAKTLIVVAFVVAVPAASADDDSPSWIMDTSGVGQDTNGVVRSDQILELGTAPSNGLQLEGESLLRRGNLNGALVALQKAVEMAPGDMDKRVLYATALEKKLNMQKPKDPTLYNFLVKQWYFIYKKAEFIDQSLQAREHVSHLTGTVPKTFERDKTFLSRVLIPEDQIAKMTANRKQAAAQ